MKSPIQLKLIISDLRVFLSLRDLHLQTGGYKVYNLLDYAGFYSLKRINLHLPMNKIGEKYVSKYFARLMNPRSDGGTREEGIQVQGLSCVGLERVSGDDVRRRWPEFSRRRRFHEAVHFFQKMPCSFRLF
ncbi:unnamed protein product [Brassica rapa subsp. trilocularis]